MLNGLLRKLGSMCKPLWKGAAKRLLAYEAGRLRGHVKGIIDGDDDASIMRVNRICDGWQDGIIKGLSKLAFLPASIASDIADKVQDEGDSLQVKLTDAIKAKGPAAIDMAFDALEGKLGALIDAA